MDSFSDGSQMMSEIYPGKSTEEWPQEGEAMCRLC